jgi:hypothetical protein
MKYPFTPTSTTLHAVWYSIFSFPVKQRWPQRVLAYSITATASTSMRRRGSMSAETSTIEDAGYGSSK